MPDRNFLTPMIPFTAWKFGERFPHSFTVTDVYEGQDEIVYIIRVTTHSDPENLIAAVALSYAGLARVDHIEFQRDMDDGAKMYDVVLDYGSE